MERDDFDEDTLLKILDILSFDELINMANRNPTLKELIANHAIIPRFNINSKLIDLAVDDNNVHRTNSEMTDDTIIINDPILATRFLENFGGDISKMVISKSSAVADLCANAYCSDSLVELTIASNLNVTNAWNKPFKLLTDLRVDAIVMKEGNEIFGNIFPSIVSLKITTETSMAFFLYNFPNLKNVVLPSMGDNELIFFSHNPMLQNVEIGFSFVYHMENIRRASESLQKLESIKFMIGSPIVSDPYPTNHGLIHFKNVKKCAIAISSMFQSKALLPDSIPIVFDQLEELEIYTASMKPWMTFITRHVNLRTLRILTHLNGDDLLELFELSNRMKHSIDLSVDWLFDMEDTTVENLVQRQSRLNKFVVNTTHRNCDLLVRYCSITPGYTNWRPEGLHTSYVSNIITLHNKNIKAL